MSAQTIAQLFDLTGKGAIVTGGAMGIGKVIASRLAEAGASVMITDIDLESANQAAEEIKSAGGKVQAMHADASSGDDAKRVVQKTAGVFGGLDILVNNAGIYPFSPVLNTTEELWSKVIDTNLKGVFLYSQAAAQAMEKAESGGRIVNIASGEAFRPTGMCAHYSASKGGVHMLTKALALELAPMKITVNAIAPGGIMTPGTGGVRKTLKEETGAEPDEVIAEFLKRVPVGRMGEPDDIAKTVLFLVSGAADYICGETIVVDGGNLLT